MKRREFVNLLGGATSMSVLLRPNVTRAQPSPIPVVGFIDPRSPDAFLDRLRGFRQGLKDAGYAEGENVTVEYRWAENKLDRLPDLAADLARRGVAAIVASGGFAAATAARAASTTIPVIFIVAEDPVRLGLVASLAHPGGNLTGVNFVAAELTAKRLELLHELVPGATRISVLVNPADPANTEPTLRDVESAARAIGVQIQILRASTSREIDAAFAAAAHDRAEAFFVGGAPFLNIRRVQLVQLAARHAIAAIYPNREFAEIGGLISYGANIADAYRQIGVYTGRILKGAKPTDLPVVQSSRFELVINHQTARMLGLAVPATLLATADEVIE